MYIQPRFFIEKKVTDIHLGKTGNAVVYMVRCIHGEPVSIGVKDAFFNYVYTPDWKPMLQTHTEYPKPECLDTLLHYSKVLSQKFEFVRVDYYLCENNTIYFSEFTFTPSGGTRVFPLKNELELGWLWI